MNILQHITLNNYLNKTKKENLHIYINYFPNTHSKFETKQIRKNHY